MNQRSSSKLPATVLALCTAVGIVAARAASEPTALISLSDSQIRATGIQVEAARASSEVEPSGTSAGQRLSGQVVTPGNKVSVVSSAVSGYLELAFVQAGATVRAGDALARLHSADLAAIQRGYLHAKSSAAVAAGKASRDQALFDEGIIAESRLRESQSGAQMARATEQEQRRLLDLAGYSPADIDSLSADSISTSVTLRARGSGVVLEQPVPAGQHVEPGTTLFRLAPSGAWWLDLEATRAQAGAIRVGDRVLVDGCRAEGHVIAVGTQLRAATQTIPVRAEITDAGGCVSPNQYIEARVLRSRAPTGLVSVPAGALVRNGAREFLFIRKPRGFQPVPVTVERREGEHVLLKAGGGVEPGVEVASAGLVTLKGAWLGLGVSSGGQP